MDGFNSLRGEALAKKPKPKKPIIISLSKQAELQWKQKDLTEEQKQRIIERNNEVNESRTPKIHWKDIPEEWFD